MSGTMPKWRRYFHTFGAGFMCLWFAGLCILGVRVLFSNTNGRAGLALVSALFAAMSVVAVCIQTWFLRRMVSEFSYDGSVLAYRTIGAPELRMAPLSQIAEVRPWRGRGGPNGYRLVLQGAGKLYLEYSVPNAEALAAELASAAKLSWQS